MGRSRMVSDSFWTDPDLADLTTEQRTALLLYLTCQESNVIGVYRVIWRAVAAGPGWTHDQILNVSRDLQEKHCIEIDESTGWVWVKDWWKHNSIRGAFTGNVAKKARAEVAQVPLDWGKAVLCWIASNDPEGLPDGLESLFDDKEIEKNDTKVSSEGLPSPSEGAWEGLDSSFKGADGNPNPTPIPNPTTNLGGGGAAEINDLIDAAVWKAYKVGSINSEEGFRNSVRKRITNGGANPEDLRSLNAWRAHQSEIAAQRIRAEQQAREQQIQDAKRAQEAAYSAELREQFESLPSAAKEEVLDEFSKHLAQNTPFYSFYKKEALKSKIVRTEFLKFLSTQEAKASTGA